MGDTGYGIWEGHLALHISKIFPHIFRFNRNLFQMKFLVFLLAGTIIIFGSAATFAGSNDSIPELNKKIITYVKTTIGTKVNHGECWDLAAEALDRNNASWDHQYRYGKKYDPSKENVLPGDMIQFENVVLKYHKGDRIIQETMEHHTAVVYDVKEKDVLVIAHQNNGFSGRKVGLSELDLNTVTHGKMFFYHPVK